MNLSTTPIPVPGAKHEGIESVKVTIPNVRSDGKAQVRIDRKGKVVEAIHVNCSCGHRVTIDCEYEK